MEFLQVLSLLRMLAITLLGPILRFLEHRKNSHSQDFQYSLQISRLDRKLQTTENLKNKYYFIILKLS